MAQGVSKQDIENIKETLRKGAERGMREHPEEYKELMDGMGITIDTFDAWLDKQFEHIVTTEEK